MAKRIVLITGVTRGLGQAMAKEFASRGHTVLGCGRTRSQIEDLRRQWAAPHDFYVVDVALDDEVKSWASLMLKQHGPPDLVLNNAAVINRNAHLWEFSSDEFAEVIEVNLTGVANILRHFLPAMLKRKKGIIVNFSSGWGRTTNHEVAPYCASKWGLEGLTLALAKELPAGMAAITLNPGIINTQMLQSCFGPSAKNYMTPEAWAKTAVPFLLKLGKEDNGRQLDVIQSNS